MLLNRLDASLPSDYPLPCWSWSAKVQITSGRARRSFVNFDDERQQRIVDNRWNFERRCRNWAYWSKGSRRRWWGSFDSDWCDCNPNVCTKIVLLCVVGVKPFELDTQMMSISSTSIHMKDVINAFIVLISKTSLLLLSLSFNISSSTCGYRMFTPGRQVNGVSFRFKAVLYDAHLSKGVDHISLRSLQVGP